MRAAVRERYGVPTHVVELREIEKPTPGDDEVLVRVRAASANISDWYDVVGRPRVARSLGADEVVDYTLEDFTKGERRYDLLVDIAGTRSFRQLRRVLKPNATVVVVGGRRKNRLLGPLAHVVATMLAAVFASQKATFFIAKLTKGDMETIRELFEAGRLTSVIDSSYPLDQVADALAHMGAGHPRGKIVITV